MAIAIDTSVLIDILLADPAHEQQSRLALRKFAADGLVICDVTLAEIVPALKRGPATDFLRDWNIGFSACSLQSSVLAGEMFVKYLERGGKRGRIVPDFLIAAHAKLQVGALLARDRGYYRDYFGGLKLIEP